MQSDNKNFSHLLTDTIFSKVGKVADSLNMPCYVVGGYVRDLLLGLESKDIDFVTVGSGIELAAHVAKALGKNTHTAFYKNYGTAQVRKGALELEFVGARKESYRRESRNPIVEDGTLEEDIARRDFTINAMALCVNEKDYGQLVDNYNGMKDLRAGIIRTPLDPDITFSDDPLRMMRAVRFAAKLQFELYPETFEAIKRNADRIEIISVERITTELVKIIRSPKPSVGFILLHETGLLKHILPEVEALRGVEVINGRGHKDNFYHTMQVLDGVAQRSNNELLRWAALFHDIAKPITKRFEPGVGWTFYNHNIVGSNMLPRIFQRLKLPLGQELRYVRKLVELHMRPIALVEDEVTDSAVRRLMNYAEEALDDLMILARADITSKNQERKQRFLDNFDLVEEKFVHIRQVDAELAYRNPIDGNEIMHIFGLKTGPLVGYFTSNLKQAIKDCLIENTREASLEYLYKLARDKDIPVMNEPLDSGPC